MIATEPQRTSEDSLAAWKVLMCNKFHLNQDWP